MKKLPIVATIVTFIAIVILLKLGLWQLQRAAEKSHIAEQQQQAATRVYDSITSAIDSAEATDFKRVKVQGKVDTTRLFFWDNRINDGSVGYEILAPVFTNAGVLLVNLGWLKDPHFRQRLPEFTLTTENLDTVVVLYTPGANQLSRHAIATEGWPRLIQNPDFGVIAAALEQRTLPILGFVEEPEEFGLKSNFRPVTMTPEKHMGYAVQWFLLAFSCFIVYLFAVRKKIKNERKT